MKNFKLVLLFIILSPCLNSQAADVEVMSFEELEQEMQKWDEGIFLVNFWATWCSPCVKEMPFFEEVNRKYKDDVHVVLVSLNFKSELDSRVIPFIEKNSIDSRVILLNAPDYNSWINRVNADWSGTIPATLVLKPSEDYSAFYEQIFELDQLEEIITNLKSIEK